MNKRGSVPLLVAGIIPAILLTGVFAAEASRYWLKNARLQAALDAGALYAAANMNRADRDANVRALVAATYNENAPSDAKLSASDVQVQSVGTDKVKVSASAGSSLLAASPSILGSNNPLVKANSIAGSATANVTKTGIELALVFDITLSMVQQDAGSISITNPCSGAATRIKAGCDAALILLRSLYGDQAPTKAVPNPVNRTWLENLYVSVVPFNVTVNYGQNNTHFITGGAPPSPGYATSWTGAATSWGGCAEMRSTSLNDASPGTTGDGLRRYYWPSTFTTAEQYDPKKTNNASSQPYCLSTAAYSDSAANNVCMGHNDWTGPAALLSNKRNNLISSFADNALVKAAGLNAWTVAHGPNMMCPPQQQQVLPLTRDRATIEARIRSLVNLPFSYGTNIAAGLQAGWFTLSPNWRSRSSFAGWPNTEPTNPPDQRPVRPSLPLDYYSKDMSKTLILLTDGDNNWASAREVQTTANALVRPESRKVSGFYTSYGKLGADYPGDDRETTAVPSNPSNVGTASTTALDSAEAKIDSEAMEWCKKIKAPLKTDDPEKITIITIGFGANIGSRATTVLTNCASIVDGKRQYYPAPTAKDLEGVFKSIANDLAKLRLSQ